MVGGGVDGRAQLLYWETAGATGRSEPEGWEMRIILEDRGVCLATYLELSIRRAARHRYHVSVLLWY
jgi:hypothetical protein